MVVYTVALQALSIEFPLLRGGQTYAVLFKRKGLEVMNGPCRCSYNGELDIQPAAAKGFNIEFLNQRDKRSVEVTIEEVTAQGGKKAKIAEFKFDLLDQCNVFLRQGVHSMKHFNFRGAGTDGMMTVSLLMFPAGSAPPPPPVAHGGGSHGGPNDAHATHHHHAAGGSGSNASHHAAAHHISRADGDTTTLSTEALTMLSTLMPRHPVVNGLSSRISLSSDVAAEIEVVAQHIASLRDLPNKVSATEYEVTKLVQEYEEIKALNEEQEQRLKVEQQRKDAMGAAFDEDGNGKRAGSKADLLAEIALLKEELALSESLCHGFPASGSSEEDNAPPTPPPQIDTANAGVETDPAVVAAQMEYIADIQHQLNNAKSRMELLTTGDSIETEDSMTEVMQLLEMIAGLESTLAEAEGAIDATKQVSPSTPSPPVVETRFAKTHAGKSKSGKKKKKKVQFADDPNTDVSSALFSAHVEVERLEYALTVLDAVEHGRPVPDVPSQLQFMLAMVGASGDDDVGPPTVRRPAAVAGSNASNTAPAAAPKPKQDAFDDLFSAPPQPSSAPQPAAPGVQATPAAGAAVGPTNTSPAAPAEAPPKVQQAVDLFGDAFGTAPTAAQSQPQEVPSSTPQPRPQSTHSISQPSAPGGGFDDLFSQPASSRPPPQTEERSPPPAAAGGGSGGAVDLFGQPMGLSSQTADGPHFTPSKTADPAPGSYAVPPPQTGVAHSTQPQLQGQATTTGDLFDAFGGPTAAAVPPPTQPQPQPQCAVPNRPAPSTSPGGQNLFDDTMFGGGPSTAPPAATAAAMPSFGVPEPQQPQHQHQQQPSHGPPAFDAIPDHSPFDQGPTQPQPQPQPQHHHGHGQDRQQTGNWSPQGQGFNPTSNPTGYPQHGNDISGSMQAQPHPPQPQAMPEMLALNEDQFIKITYHKVDEERLQGVVTNLHPTLMLEQFSAHCVSEDLFGPPLGLSVKVHNKVADAAPGGGVVHFLVVAERPMVPGTGFMLVVEGMHVHQRFQRSARLRF